jgi:uncharacterized protein (TIGR00297 family)
VINDIKDKHQLSTSFMNSQFIILFIVYALFLIILGYFKPKGKHSKYLIRKSVHLITGLLIFYLTFHMSRQNLLILFIAGTVFSFASYFIRRFNYIHVTGNSSWGTLFYPVGILLSFLILYNMPIKYFQISLLFLAVSDTIANIGGYLVTGNPHFTILSEKKSAVGIMGFTVTAVLIAIALLPASNPETFFYALLVVVCAIHFEAISFKGSDNLFIPLGTAAFFYLTFSKDFNILWLTTVIIIMGVVSIFLYRTGILTRGGSIAAHLLGIYIFGILGPEWAAPVAFFFISSVTFTKINGIVHRKDHSAGNRNIWQVMANILVSVVFSILFLISGQQIYIYLYISSIAAVTADTWASEIGPIFQKRCFSLAKWGKADAGVSGGISIAGTLASFSGSILLSLLAWKVLFRVIEIESILIISTAGFLASFMDSVLGAFLEPRLEKLKYFNGGSESISPNDVVNLTASLTAPLFYLLFSHILN